MNRFIKNPKWLIRGALLAVVLAFFAWIYGWGGGDIQVMNFTAEDVERLTLSQSGYTYAVDVTEKEDIQAVIDMVNRFHHSGMLEINRSKADIVCMIFDYYMGGASLGKVVDMLQAKQVPSPTGKAKWTRAAVDHLLSNDKYIAIIGLEKFLDAQFEKSARCNVDYDKEGKPRKETRYVSPAIVQM